METQQEYLKRLNAVVNNYCYVRQLEREADKAEETKEDIVFFIFLIAMASCSYNADTIISFVLERFCNL